MKTASELEKLERIIFAIKVYRQQTADFRNPATNELLNTWLKKHLSRQDRVLWLRLRTDQERALQPPTVVHA